MKNKAVFLDRDGVINEERGEYTFRIEDFRFTCGIFDFMKAAREKGYLLILISNQGGVAKGLYSCEDVSRLHSWMQAVLEENGIMLDDMYYCPHYPDVEPCSCRKPSPLMILQAIEKYDIDPSLSVMVGDSERDAEAARRAGVKSLKIKPNEDLRPYISILA